MDGEISRVCGLQVKIPSKDDLMAMVKSTPSAGWESAKGAWASAKASLPQKLPELPEFNMPEFDWAIWK